MDSHDGAEDQNGWMVCRNLSADTISWTWSVQVEYRRPAVVQGRWHRIGEGEHTHRYYSGFFTRDQETPKTIVQGSFLAQFQLGLEFTNKHCKVNQLCSEGVRDATYQYMSSAYDEPKVEVGLCPPRVPLDDKIGYYVFVVETLDGEAAIISPNGVCRYGEDWDVAPLCPPAAC
jgi:hypothetical protein